MKTIKIKLGILLYVIIILSFVSFLMYPLYLKFGIGLFVCIAICIGIFAVCILADWLINSEHKHNDSFGTDE